jgi:hypothetical protein
MPMEFSAAIRFNKSHVLQFNARIIGGMSMIRLKGCGGPSARQKILFPFKWKTMMIIDSLE